MTLKPCPDILLFVPEINVSEFWQIVLYFLGIWSQFLTCNIEPEISLTSHGYI